MSRVDRSKLALLGGLALAGMALGHSAAYLVAEPHTGTRIATLEATGHGYWPLLAVAALLAAFAVIAVHLAGSLRVSAALTGPRLGALIAGQIGLFLVVEVAERAVAGAPLDLWAQAPLWAALPVQVAIAALCCRLLRLLGAAAVAFSAVPPPVPASSSAPVPFADDRVPSLVPCGSVSGRGPPLPSTT